MYSLEYSETFRKQIKKLPKNLQSRIISPLERIRIRPFSHVKKLSGNPYFSLKAGSYRIILDVQKGKLIIFIIEVGYRKKIYKN